MTHGCMWAQHLIKTQESPRKPYACSHGRDHAPAQLREEDCSMCWPWRWDGAGPVEEWISCDNCIKRFHGDCIKTTEKKAKVIREEGKSHRRVVLFARRKVAWNLLEKPLLKKSPEFMATFEAPSDMDVHLDPELYQDIRPRVFDDRDVTQNASFLDPGLGKSAVKLKHVKQLKSEKRYGQKQRQEDLSEHRDIKYPGSMPQCLGPRCVQPAQPGSKYCSNDCGLKLAFNRICKILPQQVQQWQRRQHIAEERGKELLEQIQREQEGALMRLQDLERCSYELEAVILRAKQLVVKKDEEINERDSKVRDLQIFCVSCGNSVSSKVALRHMEHCYAKYERQATMGSMHPTTIEGATQLFCNVYNPECQTYCKRLQVLCPEHSTDPQVSEDEVCGCPLMGNVFELTGDFCHLPKLQCNWHYCWEKLRRAEVDLERVRVRYKLEELRKQERKVRRTMTSQADFLALMLHQTTQHDPLTTDLRTNVNY
ncbi:CXXC-type zinc finger protein 1-like [Monodelphis domestica]|uniref:CXXC-type zinc finger protein 1-like n=1 Tax=Monodelphis domestica TaxID=13616 RepID=UPI0024E20D49|nr:CXXC-type zinc finger protein 1-like [Monodelphis domestica]